MTRFLSGMFITSLVFIAGYVYGPGLLARAGAKDPNKELEEEVTDE